MSGPERVKQLEDNLTRALIVTIKYLEKDIKKEFLRLLLGVNKIESNSFKFDLQNSDLYDHKTPSTKYLVILQRQISDITVHTLKSARPDFLDDLSGPEQKSLVDQLKRHLSTEYEKPLDIKGRSTAFSELNSILQLIHGNRADGWIVGDRECIFFEAKIGGNSVSQYQIFRHVTGKDGLRIKRSAISEGNPIIVSTTWDKLREILNHLSHKVQGDKENFLIAELLNYIALTGQTMNFNYISESGGRVDPVTHREQFGLFLTRLDKKLEGTEITREKRAKSDLWEVYSKPGKDGKLTRDPHYSVEFRDYGIGVSLTTKKQRQINLGFERNLASFVDEISELVGKSSVVLSRYFLSQQMYRLLDKKRGQIKGETHNTFKFYIQFSQISKSAFIASTIRNFAEAGIAKQFDLGYEIKFFNFRKVDDNAPGDGLRAANKQSLRNPEEIVESVAAFMFNTEGLYDQLRGQNP